MNDGRRVNGYEIKPFAHLGGAHLGGADLGGADLGGADLGGADLGGAHLSGADLGGAHLSGADLSGADLSGADLSGADLSGAKLDKSTTLPTGETWETYLREVVPALLTAGGKALADVATPQHWNCHRWSNCPMAAAFDTPRLELVPALLRPRAKQFIAFFDAGLILLEAVWSSAAPAVSADAPEVSS